MILRSRYLLLFDALLILLSVLASYSLRFDTFSVWDYFSQNWLIVPFLLTVRLPLFYFFGLYRRLWRYASVNELIAIGEAVLLGSVVAGATILVISQSINAIFPRSIILLEGMLTFLLVGGSRFSFRLSHHAQVRPRAMVTGDQRARAQARVLIFGAGDAGALIVREIGANPDLGLEAVAFLDDDASKKGLRIHNIPVLGDRSVLAEVIKAHTIDAAVIAMPTAPGRVIREITELCRRLALPVKTIPGLYEILGGAVKVSAIREVQLEDLLRREPVKIDLKQVGQYLGGVSVLVTGAGGSIGSELCRQIARFEPRRLILLELAENHLYQIDRELTGRFPSLEVVPIVGDIRDAGKVEAVFSKYTPKVVFHAAAHKHVPLMERNVDELVLNNIFGTRNVIEASLRHPVKRFVLISTDKAVNPKSAMGVTKRVAELLAQNAARASQCAIVVVRFGNVLGSSGSVVPLFKEQIAGGGPVTVTHPEIDRYFMTIPEAVSLIIQAAALGGGGEIFVLNMGEPVKITDMASDMIRLSGLEPGQDIEIVYSGLRPGEKLHEELFRGTEAPRQTAHPQILVVQGDLCDPSKLQPALKELETLAQTRDAGKLIAKLQEIVPEYMPQA